MNIGQALLAALGAGPTGGGLSAGAVDGASPETALAFAGTLASLGAASPGALLTGQTTAAQQPVTRLPDLGANAAEANPLQQITTPGTSSVQQPANILRDTAVGTDQAHEKQPSAAELLAASLLSLLPSEVDLGAQKATLAPKTTTADATVDTAMADAAMQSVAQLDTAQPLLAAPPEAHTLSADQLTPQPVVSAAVQGPAAAIETGIPAQRISSPTVTAEAATGPGEQPSTSGTALAPAPASTATSPAVAAPQQGMPLPAGMTPVVPLQDDADRSSRRAELKVDRVSALSPAPALPNAVPTSVPAAVQATGNDVQPPTPIHHPAGVAPQVSAQLTGHIGRLQSLSDGTHRMIIRIDPESLGPVRVVAQISSGSLQVHLHATTQSGQAALAASLEQVRSDLARIAPTASLELGSGQFSQPQGGQNPQQSTDLSFGGDFSGGRGGGQAGSHGASEPQESVPAQAGQRSPARGTRAAQGATDDHAVDVTA